VSIAFDLLVYLYFFIIVIAIRVPGDFYLN